MLFVVFWPLALAALLLYPLICLLSFVFKAVGAVVGIVFAVIACGLVLAGFVLIGLFAVPWLLLF